MHNTSSNIAILLFSKFSQDCLENEKKFLRGESPALNHQIAATLFHHSFQVVQKTNLPVFWIGADLQRGNSFGERISNAIVDIFAKGFQKVIVVGDDCPNLSIKDFQKTIQAFAQNQNAMGYAQDGGAYLIGIDSADFQVDTFSALPWQTEYLGDALDTYLQNNQKEVFLLARKADIDDAKDWAKIFTQLPHYQSFKKLILTLFAIRISLIVQYDILLPQNSVFISPNLRAPPRF